MAASYPCLQEIRLKRMVITDDSLDLIAKSFKNFTVLVLTSCEGFTTVGLAAIAANCRFVCYSHSLFIFASFIYLSLFSNVT